MGLTLTQLVATRTKENIRNDLLLAMQGVGFVSKSGAGEGNLTLTGVAEDDLSIVISITAAGSLGVATFRYSLDGGSSTNGVDIVVPSGGNYVLPDTGVTLVFENGPGEAEDSFYTGDSFSFDIATPTLPTTSWHVGSTVRTIIEKDAECLENYTETVQKLAQSGFLSTSSDAWLDIVLEEVYDLTREKGQAAQHTVLLEDTAGGGPFTIVAGQLTAATATGLRFTNVDGGTLAQDGTLSLTFQAEGRGTQYNAGIGAINLLLTTLPGVSVTNTAIVQQGINRETDAAARKRAKLRWPALGVGVPEAVYELAITEATDDITRIRVETDPDVPGGTLVTVAGPAGAIVDTDVLDAAQEAVEAIAPFGTVATVESAVTQALAFEADVWVRAGYSSSALAAMTANLTAFIQGGVNSIGEELEGLDIGDGTTTVYVSEMVEQLQVVTGVRNVVITSPPGDVSILGNSVIVLDPAPIFNIVEV